MFTDRPDAVVRWSQADYRDSVAVHPAVEPQAGGRAEVVARTFPDWGKEPRSYPTRPNLAPLYRRDRRKRLSIYEQGRSLSGG